MDDKRRAALHTEQTLGGAGWDGSLGGSTSVLLKARALGTARVNGAPW